jgi:hypothetical protein
MGYGYDDNEEIDYGYGDDAGDDYGYGDGSPDGDECAATPEEDYGYGDSDPADEPVMAPPEKSRPKRRCSVTKYNLDNDNVLTAADRIKELRDESTVPDTKGYQTDEKSSEEGSTQDSSSPPSTMKPEVMKKKGVMSRMRKRLSLAF